MSDELEWALRSLPHHPFTAASHPSSTREWFYATKCNRFAILVESEKEVRGRSRWFTPFRITGKENEVFFKVEKCGETQTSLSAAKRICQQQAGGSNA